MVDERHVLIIGGGVVGLSTAWYLSERGARVTVLEARTVGSGSSFANGGWLCPAQAGPLAEPGLTLFALKSFLDRDSALYMSPPYLPRALSWFLQFRTYCTKEAFARGMAAIAGLGAETFALVEGWRDAGVDVEVRRQGMVYAAKDVKSARAALENLQAMRAFGYALPDDLMTGTELHAFEPALSEKIQAGFYVEEHWHVRSDQMVSALTAALRSRGVTVREGTEVVRATRDSSGRLKAVSTASETFEADDFVLATGAWRDLFPVVGGPRIPVEAGKGYSFSVRPTVMPRHAVLLTDVHVGCTPFDEFMRIGGTMEFSGLNRRIDHERVDAIARGARTCFQPFEDTEIREVWSGPRPITPDGLPVLDRLPGVANAYAATGHAMQGVTLAPGSGKALAAFITTGRRPRLLEPFRADRFWGGRRVGRGRR